MTMSAASALEEKVAAPVIEEQLRESGLVGSDASAPGEGQPNDARARTDVGQEIREQEVTEEREKGQSAAAEAALTGVEQRRREESAARIRNLVTLPPVLRERLAELVQISGEMADGKARVPIDDAIRAVETALPEFLRVDRAQARQPSHPTGEAFFASDPGDLTEAQAEELARGQLARSGMLRGQRVREAD
jgi:hypothetical protein